MKLLERKHLLFLPLVIFSFVSVTAQTQESASWGTNATSHRGQNNSRFAYSCPSNGSAGTVWGSDLYTDDSSICTAGVHAGVISFRDGGRVVIEMRPGAGSYAATTRYGVTTRAYGSWHGSYVVVKGKPNEPVNVGITWTIQADGLRGKNGQRFTYVCPANGTASGRLWGDRVYTDDSSICTAAVHGGFIGTRNGGTVTIEVRPGMESYGSSTRNGVTSKSYGRWHGNFVFVN